MGITQGTHERLRELLGEVGLVNVRAEGAEGDGVADDGAIIQAAIDAGGEVYLPAGTYLFSETLFYDSKSVLRGAGMGVTTLVYTGTGIAIDQRDAEVRVDFVRFADFTLRVAAESDTVDGLRLLQCWNSHIERVEILNFRRGVDIADLDNTIGCWWNKVRDCKFDGCLESVRYTGEGTGVPNANQVSGCNIHMRNHADSIAINVDSGDTSRVIGNWIEGQFSATGSARGKAIRVNGYQACVGWNRIERTHVGIHFTVNGYNSLSIANPMALAEDATRYVLDTPLVLLLDFAQDANARPQWTLGDVTAQRLQAGELTFDGRLRMLVAEYARGLILESDAAGDASPDLVFQDGDGVKIRLRKEGDRVQMVADDGSTILQEFGSIARLGMAGGTLGLYGVAPVARQTIAAAATDLDSVIALANDLRAKGITIGAFQA